MTDEGHNGSRMGMANVLDYAQNYLISVNIKKQKTLNQIPYRALAVAEIILHEVFYGKMPLGAPNDFKTVEGP